MDTNKKQLLIALGLGLAGYMYLNPATKETYYTINGQRYSKTQLQSMGYKELNGQMWSPAMIAQAAAQGGVSIPNSAPGTNAGGDQTWMIISTLLNTGMQFVPLFLNTNNTGGGGMTGGGTNTGSGSGSGSSSMS